MFNKRFYITIISILILSISCGNRPTAPEIWREHKNYNLLIGDWLNLSTVGSQYGEEKYIYNGQNFTSVNAYTISVEEISWTSDTSGFIYGKYTENTYTPSDVGKYYAVSFKDLTDTTISIAGAYHSEYGSSADSLNDAKANFTIDNGSFSFYSSCDKQ